MSENGFVPGGLPASSGPAPRRGRPTNAEIAARNAASESQAPQPQPARVDAEKKQRRRRADTSETRNMKLSVPRHIIEENRGFELRWVNDTASGRIHSKTVEDDWDFVTTKDRDGKEVEFEKVVGTGENGQPLKSRLLKKPKEFCEEDRGRKQAAIQAQEDQLRRGVTPDPEGLSGPHAYVPGGSNTIERGR